MDFENDISVDRTFKKLNDPNVKDLYWLLFSACPINNCHPMLDNIPLFPQEILEEWRLDSSAYFVKLDKNPEDLRHFLNRPKNKRLGFYAEALLSFFFQTYSKVELLLQNFQIIDDKKTLGELDFIIKWNNRVIHLECAVKFYLCNHSQNVDDLHSWIGPACKDDLGKKIIKVKEKQLPMIDSPVFRSQISQDNIESFLFLKGVMYVNQETKCDWINKDLLGHYFRLNEVDSKNEFYLLSKPYWMSSLIDKKESRQLKRFKGEDFGKRAELIVKTKSVPFFIVPKNWPF